MNELAMHRSQSVMLPTSQQQQAHLYHHHMMGVVDPTMQPMVEANEHNLAGHHHGFDNFVSGHHRRADKAQAHLQVHDHHHDVLNLNFFDESAQELSSIDHSAAPVDAYGYSQAGPNPYEQAKRQYLKKQQSQQADAVVSSAKPVDE